MVTVKVQRFDPDVDSEPYFVEYEVPFQQGMRVLAALHYIHDHIDGTLSFRWICC